MIYLQMLAISLIVLIDLGGLMYLIAEIMETKEIVIIALTPVILIIYLVFSFYYMNFFIRLIFGV